MPYPQLTAPSRGQGRILGLIVVLLVLLVSARTIASFFIDYQWWKEMGQLSTWFSMLLYRIAPAIAASLLAWLVLLTAHAGGLRFAKAGSVRNRWYKRIVMVVLLGIGVFVGVSAIDTWTVVRFFGSRNLPAQATTWQDAVFGLPLSFYLFDLPFYSAHTI